MARPSIAIMHPELAKIAAAHSEAMRAIQKTAHDHTMSAAKEHIEYVEAPWNYTSGLIAEYLEIAAQRFGRTHGGEKDEQRH